MVPGGEQVTIRLFGRVHHKERETRVWVGAGDAHLATATFGREWAEVTMGPFDWPAGAPLVVRNVTSMGAAIVDRAELEWR